MYFIDLIAPIKRKKTAFISTFFLIFLIIFGGILLFPPVEKTTIYFSLKPLSTENTLNNNNLSNAIEEGSKVAETVAGWAKNPGFRQKIMDKANIEIENFKNKLSAQRQNRLNVFLSIKLFGKEIQNSETIIKAVMTTFDEEFRDFNTNNALPFGYSNPSIFTQRVEFSISLKILFSLFTSLFLTWTGYLLWGILDDRLLFGKTIREIFPDAPILKIQSFLQKHDEELIQHFLLTFSRPKLVGIFEKSGKYLPLEKIEKIDLEKDSPIVLVRIWDTKIKDIENMKAIFGDNIGIIIFEK